MLVRVPLRYPIETLGKPPTPDRTAGAVREAPVAGACARREGRRPGREGARALHVTQPAGGDAHDAPLTWSVSSPVAGGGGRGRVPVASHPEELVAQL